jgi:hypothetical protein
MSQINNHRNEVIETQIGQLLDQILGKYPDQSLYLDFITFMMIRARQSGVSRRHLNLVINDALEISDKYSSIDIQDDISLPGCHLKHFSSLKRFK